MENHCFNNGYEDDINIENSNEILFAFLQIIS